MVTWCYGGMVTRGVRRQASQHTRPLKGSADIRVCDMSDALIYGLEEAQAGLEPERVTSTPLGQRLRQLAEQITSDEVRELLLK